MEKKTNKNIKGMLNDAATRVKDIAGNANNMALYGTEKVVTQSLEMTGQWQNVADQAIKGGLRLAANQQSMVFDILDVVKSDLKATNKRLRDLVS
ncbi:MAG: hypothetical protein AAFO69_15850 [Bacteroidota bacterium]